MKDSVKPILPGGMDSCPDGHMSGPQEEVQAANTLEDANRSV